MKHLAASSYHQSKHSPGLFMHECSSITLCLIVDNFGIKLDRIEHAYHLLSMLCAQYKITHFLSRLCKTCTPQVSAPHISQKKHATHAYSTPKYGTTTQITIPTNTSYPLDATGPTRLQYIVGTLLYCGLAVNSTMIVALDTLADDVNSQDKAQTITQLLKYFVTYPDSIMRFHCSDMCLNIHSGYSCISEPKDCIRAGG